MNSAGPTMVPKEKMEGVRLKRLGERFKVTNEKRGGQDDRFVDSTAVAVALVGGPLPEARDQVEA